MKETNKQRSSRAIRPSTHIIENPKRYQTPAEHEIGLISTFMDRCILYLTVAIVLTLLIACTPQVEVRYVQAPLSRPVRPVLPTIKEQELSCVQPDTYQRLYDRQRLIGEYAKTLEAIVDSTRPVENKK